MRKLYIAFAMLILTSFVVAEKLEIHHLGVGQGDATLIIAQHDDGKYTTILIDTSNSSGKGQAIFRHMEHHLANRYKRLDCLVISHLHSDHYGGAPILLTNLQQNGWQVGMVIDKGEKTHGLAPFILHGNCYDCSNKDPYFDNDPVEPEITLFGSSLDEFLEKAKEFPRKNIGLGTDLFQLTKYVNTKMSMVCIASNVKVFDRYGSKSFIDKEAYADSENDFSYGFVLEFEGFRYFTGGDLGGKDPAYLDLETPIVNYFKTWPVGKNQFHCCTLKVSHHGSVHSTNHAFAEYLQPTVSFIQSALRSYSGTQLPGKQTIDTLEGVNSKIYYTYVPDANSQYWQGNVEYYKDVILTISRNPGYNRDIPLVIKTRLREKTGDLNWIGEEKTHTIYCNKPHPAYK